MTSLEGRRQRVNNAEKPSRALITHSSDQNVPNHHAVGFLPAMAIILWHAYACTQSKDNINSKVNVMDHSSALRHSEEIHVSGSFRHVRMAVHYWSGPRTAWRVGNDGFSVQPFPFLSTRLMNQALRHKPGVDGRACGFRGVGGRHKDLIRVEYHIIGPPPPPSSSGWKYEPVLSH